MASMLRCSTPDRPFRGHSTEKSPCLASHLRRGKADVLYVADAFEVMRKVNALLGTTRT
jgi:hypothetical protein